MSEKSQLRRHVVLRGVDLYDHCFVLDSILDALDDADLMAITGLPCWLVSSWRYKCYHLDDNLFTRGKRRPTNFAQNV